MSDAILPNTWFLERMQIIDGTVCDLNGNSIERFNKSGTHVCDFPYGGISISVTKRYLAEILEEDLPVGEGPVTVVEKTTSLPVRELELSDLEKTLQERLRCVPKPVRKGNAMADYFDHLIAEGEWHKARSRVIAEWRREFQVEEPVNVKVTK